MREVAVIGVGQSVFRKFPQKTATELGGVVTGMEHGVIASIHILAW